MTSPGVTFVILEKHVIWAPGMGASLAEIARSCPVAPLTILTLAVGFLRAPPRERPLSGSAAAVDVRGHGRRLLSAGVPALWDPRCQAAEEGGAGGVLRLDHLPTA